jgi:hypothetical protein
MITSHAITARDSAMKSRHAFLALALLSPPIHAQDLSSAANKRCEQSTQTMLAALQTADFNSASENFSPSLRERLTPEKLRSVWESLPVKVGALRAIGRFHAGRMGGHPEVYIPLIFERATVTGDVACANDGTITDFKLTPPHD